MPLIMDAHDHYMDDLFGDAPQVQIPQLPILKTLSQRLDDMAGSNACQYAYPPFDVISIDSHRA